jgi:hypothetical protein
MGSFLSCLLLLLLPPQQHGQPGHLISICICMQGHHQRRCLQVDRAR